MTATQKRRAYGIALHKRMLDLNINQKELAELVGIDPKRISVIVRGTSALYDQREKIERMLEKLEEDMVS